MIGAHDEAGKGKCMMTVTKHEDRRREASRSGPWVSRGWVAVALIPVFFFLALALGYVLYDLLGYKPENDDAPFWVDLICTVWILVVSLAPCVAAVEFGRRAAGSGDRRGLLPLGVGALAGLGLTILSVVGLIA
jgi:hypothetical protein